MRLSRGRIPKSGCRRSGRGCRPCPGSFGGHAVERGCGGELGSGGAGAGLVGGGVARAGEGFGESLDRAAADRVLEGRQRGAHGW